MNSAIFYVSHKFLCEATKEMYSLPANLNDSKYYLLVFKLFMHKINSQKDIAFVTPDSWKAFRATRHITPFESNKILNLTIKKEDENGTQYPNEILSILDKASITSGKVGETDVVIVVEDSELAEFKSADTGYPVQILTVEEAISVIDKIYSPSSAP